MRAALLVLLLAAFGLRAYALGAKSFWHDEGYSAFLSSHPWAQLTVLTAQDIHPPLYYYLLRGWMLLAGPSEFALRFLSLAFGVLLVALLFRAGAHIFGPAAGLGAALMGASSPLLVAYSQEARMYTMAAFLALLSVYLLRRVWSSPRLWLWAGYAATGAAMLYTHYYLAFVLAAEALVLAVLAVGGRKPQQGEKALAAYLAMALLYLPWAGIATRQLAGYGNPWLEPPPLELMLWQTAAAFHFGEFWPAEAAGPWLGMAAALLGLLLVVGWRSIKPSAGLLLCLAYLFVPVAAALAIAAWRPMWNVRYVLPALPAYYLLWGFLVTQPRGRAAFLGPLALAGWAGVSLWALGPYYAAPKDDARRVAQYLRAAATPQDAVLVDIVHPFPYYGAGPPSYEFLPLEPPEDEALRRRVVRLARGRERVFFVRWDQSSYDAKGLTAFLLASHGQQMEERRFPGYTVSVYRLPPGEGAWGSSALAWGSSALAWGSSALAWSSSALAWSSSPPLRQTYAAFGGQIALTGQAYSPEVAAGGLAPTVLRWQKEGSSPVPDLAARVLLVDRQGREIARLDKPLLSSAHFFTARWPPGEAHQNYYPLPVPPGTPPGEYSLRVGVYRASDGRDLSLLGPGGIPAGGTALLGQVRVARGARAERPGGQPWGVFNGELALWSAEGLPTTAAPGQELRWKLCWEALRRPQHDYLVRWQVRAAEGGRLWAQREARPVDGTYGTKEWEEGELVCERGELLLPAAIPPGQYDLWVALREAGGDALAGEVRVGRLQVTALKRQFAAPPISMPRQVDMEDRVRLLGYDGNKARLRPGETLKLVLYWQTLAPMETSYTIFVHLLGEQNRIYAQADRPPLGGARPTTGWLAGEVLADPYELRVPADAPPGRYLLEIGMYDAFTMRRLRVADEAPAPSADAILLGELWVEK